MNTSKNPSEVVGNVTSDHYVELSPGTDYRKATGKLEIARAHMAIGGGGFNLAHGLSTFGLPVELVGSLSLPARRQLAELHPNIGTTRCGEQPDAPVSFILRQGVEQVILVKRAAARLGDALDYLITSPNPLVITPQPRANNEDLLRLFANLPLPQAGEGEEKLNWEGRPILWLPGAHQFDIVKLGLTTGCVTCFICNDAEAMRITKEDSPEMALVALKSYARGKTEVVITSRHRAMAYSQGSYFFENSFQAERLVDATGCGDGFSAAYFGSRLAGESVREALLNGLANAASVLAHLGASAGHLTQAEVAAFRCDHTQVEEEPDIETPVFPLAWAWERAPRVTALAAAVAVMLGAWWLK